MTNRGNLSVNQTPVYPQDRYNATFDARHPGRRAEIKRNYKKRIRAKYDELVSSMMCESCGCRAEKSNRWNMHFHHRNPLEKSFSIGLCDHSWSAILKELSKCDVLCYSCHAKLHSDSRSRTESGTFGREVAA